MTEENIEQQELDAILAEIKDRIPPPWGKTIACGEGWHQLVAKCHLELKALDPNYEICQIKEKFGTLRFYFWTKKDDETELAMWKTSQKYELASAELCELTGKPGKLMFKQGLYKTLAEEYEKEGWEPSFGVEAVKIFGKEST
jgi:hypothetical protein